MFTHQEIVLVVGAYKLSVWPRLPKSSVFLGRRLSLGVAQGSVCLLWLPVLRIGT